MKFEELSLILRFSLDVLNLLNINLCKDQEIYLRSTTSLVASRNFLATSDFIRHYILPVGL